MRARDESGQVLVEAAVVVPLALLCLLGLLQLVLLQEARLLVEYAGYRAARTGSLWNADTDRMVASARLVLGPTACPSRWPGVSCPPTDRPELRAAAGAEALRVLSAGGGFPGLALSVRGPALDLAEWDFDDPAARPDDGVITVELRYWVELRVPFADSGLWHAWRAVGGARELQPATRLAVEAAAAAGRYFVPIETRHAFRMQSNRFRPEGP